MSQAAAYSAEYEGISNIVEYHHLDKNRVLSLFRLALDSNVCGVARFASLKSDDREIWAFLAAWDSTVQRVYIHIDCVEDVGSVPARGYEKLTGADSNLVKMQGPRGWDKF